MRAYTAKMLFTTALLVWSIKYSSASCTPIAVEQDDDAQPELAAKKAEYAMAVISEAEYLAKDQDCVRSAMMYLGATHVQKAIPRLVALLAYHQEPRVGHKPRLDDEYPAIPALFRMGKPAVSALIEVIASQSNDTIESKNALDAHMSIYREEPSEGIRVLKNAAVKQTNPEAASRLRQAAQDAKLQWCRSSPCTE
jgi:hypothetical protein